MVKTDKELTPEQYHICREKGTEPAFSGKYWDCKEVGVYHCVCCGAALFNSKDKFDSGSGWPSFTQPNKDNSLTEHPDKSHDIHRVEVTCHNCEAHLGHVFPDGPAPTHLRYCVNSAALDLKKS